MITKHKIWQTIQKELKIIAREQKVTNEVMKKIRELKNEDQ
jgi:hypothetical protein